MTTTSDKVTCECIISIIDPLLLEITVTDLERRVQTTEHQLELALGRIAALEDQVNQLTASVPPSAPVVNETPPNDAYPSTSKTSCPSLPEWSTSVSPEIEDDIYIYSDLTPECETFTPYYSSKQQVNYMPQPSLQCTSPLPYKCQSQSTQPPYSSPSSSVKCIPIPDNSNSLASTSIKKAKLIPVAQCLDTYSKLQTESKVTVLAVKLAREAFFGPNVMMQCTTMGHGRFPGLPSKELNDLKQTIFSLFPKYWSSPAIFEGLWRNCAESVGQACKRLRTESAKIQKTSY